MNTSQLECFTAVAENLNFARASEYLHITQPAVTHQINSLETELGRSLFKRTTRSVSLTIDGLRFLPDAKKILEDIHVAQIRLRHNEDSEMTPFSIGCNNNSELLFLPRLLAEMKEACPSLHPTVRILPLRAAGSLLANESLDVLLGFRAGYGGHEALKFKELASAPVVCAVSPDHPLASSGLTLLRLADIKKEPLAVLEPQKTLPEIMELQNHLVPNHNASEIYPCGSSEMALALTKAGITITLLPFLEPMQDPGLCYLPLEQASSASYGIYYKTKKDRPLVRKFLAAAEECFEK